MKSINGGAGGRVRDDVQKEDVRKGIARQDAGHHLRCLREAFPSFFTYVAIV